MINVNGNLDENIFSHICFIITGRIQPEESLFYYAKGSEHAEAFQNHKFIPMLDPVTLDSFPTAAERKLAEQVCGTFENEAKRICLYDYYVTGNMALAAQTRKTEGLNILARNEMGEIWLLFTHKNIVYVVSKLSLLKLLVQMLS